MKRKGATPKSIPKEDRSPVEESKWIRNSQSINQQKQSITKNQMELPLSNKAQEINRLNRGVSLQSNHSLKTPALSHKIEHLDVTNPD